MALRDQPYLPLYIQDILTDEKLIECSAASHGVYLRMLCLWHKQDIYGEFCLKQKHKQNEDKIRNFALLLCKQMPFDEQTIYQALSELLDEKVITIEGDILFQKRMRNDGKLSLLRSEIGKTGGSSVTKQYGKPGFLYWITNHYEKNKIGISVNPQNRLYRLRCDLKIKHLEIYETISVPDMGTAEDIALDFFSEERNGEWIEISFDQMLPRFDLLKAKFKAKTLPNYENEYENVIKYLGLENISIEEAKTLAMVVVEMMTIWMDRKPDYKVYKELDYHACLRIAYLIAGVKGFRFVDVTGVKELDVLKSWEKIALFIANHTFYTTLTLDAIGNDKMFQKIETSIRESKNNHGGSGMPADVTLAEARKNFKSQLPKE